MAARARTITLICQLDRGLEHGTALPIHIELAAREPAHVGRIRRVEQQQGRLPAFHIEVQQQPAGFLFEAEFEASLTRDILHELEVELEEHQLMRAGFQALAFQWLLYQWIVIVEGADAFSSLRTPVAWLGSF